jgi:tRNA (adenine57-N1/adenine58-N1)-methyltransferase catalytic subunit
VRPDHRMVAHSGFITVARKVEPGVLGPLPESEDLADQDQARTAETEEGCDS